MRWEFFRNVFKREREIGWNNVLRESDTLIRRRIQSSSALNHEWFMYSVNIVSICISSDQNQKDEKKKKKINIFHFGCT